MKRDHKNDTFSLRKTSQNFKHAQNTQSNISRQSWPTANPITNNIYTTSRKREKNLGNYLIAWSEMKKMTPDDAQPLWKFKLKAAVNVAPKQQRAGKQLLEYDRNLGNKTRQVE